MSRIPPHTRSCPESPGVNTSLTKRKSKALGHRLSVRPKGKTRPHMCLCSRHPERDHGDIMYTAYSTQGSISLPRECDAVVPVHSKRHTSKVYVSAFLPPKKASCIRDLCALLLPKLQDMIPTVHAVFPVLFRSPNQTSYVSPFSPLKFEL